MNLLTLALTDPADPAETGAVFKFREPPPTRDLTVQFAFVYGSGGSTVDAYLQTSLDSGITWVDLANFHATTSSARRLVNLTSRTPQTSQLTPTDGSMSANAAVDGVIGDLLRVKFGSTGSYAGSTTLSVDVSTGRLAPA